jgi:hypothetical protein
MAMNDNAHDTDESRNDDATRNEHERERVPGSGSAGPETQKRDGIAGQAQDHVEELLDEGLEESFPASDPPSIPVPRERPPRKADE